MFLLKLFVIYLKLYVITQTVRYYSQVFYLPLILILTPNSILKFL